MLPRSSPSCWRPTTPSQHVAVRRSRASSARPSPISSSWWSTTASIDSTPALPRRRRRPPPARAAKRDTARPRRVAQPRPRRGARAVASRGWTRTTSRCRERLERIQAGRSRPSPGSAVLGPGVIEPRRRRLASAPCTGGAARPSRRALAGALRRPVLPPDCRPRSCAARRARPALRHGVPARARTTSLWTRLLDVVGWRQPRRARSSYDSTRPGLAPTAVDLQVDLGSRIVLPRIARSPALARAGPSSRGSPDPAGAPEGSARGAWRLFDSGGVPRRIELGTTGGRGALARVDGAVRRRAGARCVARCGSTRAACARGPGARRRRSGCGPSAPPRSPCSRSSAAGAARRDGA